MWKWYKTHCLNCGQLLTAFSCSLDHGFRKTKEEPPLPPVDLIGLVN